MENQNGQIKQDELQLLSELKEKGINLNVLHSFMNESNGMQRFYMILQNDASEDVSKPMINLNWKEA